MAKGTESKNVIFSKLQEVFPDAFWEDQGKILRIPSAPGLKIPHMGWNSIQLQNNGRLFREIPDQSYVYFVHSYYLKAEDSSIVTATAEYGVTIDASVEKDNIFATQFHPEKSSSVGLRILKNYCEL